MSIPIPRELLELVLLGPADDRRQLQDSPILSDVWVAYATQPDRQHDLLIEPYRTEPAGRVASVLADRIGNDVEHVANIAYLQGILAAQLTFEDLLRYVVPMTYWWTRRKEQNEFAAFSVETVAIMIEGVMSAARALKTQPQSRFAQTVEGPSELRLTPLERYIVLSGLILWASSEPSPARPLTLRGLLRRVNRRAIAERLVAMFLDIEAERAPRPLIWQVSLNRFASPALEKSVPAVKADAARQLFSVRCNEISWAVLDSGIDATHPAFRGADGKPRVARCYDFSLFRQIISLDNLKPAVLEERLQRLLRPNLIARMNDQQARELLKTLAQDARSGRQIHWGLVEKFIEISVDTPPNGSHGTHVAGIIGASAAGGTTAGFNCSDGMCPDIQLYDFRVLARTATDTEFAIIAALQYIRHLNERNSFMNIHGANLSLSIPHDVRNFACGYTPVCDECERLIESGVVVVAAAGNRGYQAFETRDGSFESYAAFSITDPGNAESVITVGATHRYWPHTYGVSFFSSRGPTGDGRPKPDLVAPGERIEGPLPNNGWGQQDGTSMATPHVSGAAALLMAKHSELIGQPRRIKRIICETATDLGRERSFQGSGMLDVLRAFQKI